MQGWIKLHDDPKHISEILPEVMEDIRQRVENCNNDPEIKDDKDNG